MGNNICTNNTNQPEYEEIFFNYAFGEDAREPSIEHSDILTSNHKTVEYHLKDCENKLKISGKLYKDPTMKTDPIILKSLSSNES